MVLDSIHLNMKLSLLGQVPLHLAVRLNWDAQFILTVCTFIIRFCPFCAFGDLGNINYPWRNRALPKVTSLRVLLQSKCCITLSQMSVISITADRNLCSQTSYYHPGPQGVLVKTSDHQPRKPFCHLPSCHAMPRFRGKRLIWHMQSPGTPRHTRRETRAVHRGLR